MPLSSVVGPTRPALRVGIRWLVERCLSATANTSAETPPRRRLAHTIPDVVPQGVVCPLSGGPAAFLTRCAHYSTEANGVLRAELKKKLGDFAADTSRENVTFPVNISSYERYVVHVLAGALGLLHESSGGIDERAIVVWKKGTAPPAPKASDRVSELLQELVVTESRAQAAAVISELVIAGVLLRPRGVTIALEALRQRKMLDEAIALHCQMPSPTVVTYNALITACGNAGELGKALGFFDTMRAAKVRPDGVTYSALITACGNAGELGKALGFFDEMRAAKVRPNEYTYNALITACGNAGELGKALGFFDTMRAAGVKPNEVTYNALITACGNAEDLLEGTRFFQEMCNAGVRPTHVTFTALMELCDRCGRPDLVEQAFAFAVGQGRFKAAVTSRKHGSGTNRHAIDLHGCSKLVALAALRHKLDSPTGRDLAVGLCIITGQGHHSIANPALPVAVRDLLKSAPYAGLEAAVDPANHGCIVIGAARLATWHAAKP